MMEIHKYKHFSLSYSNKLTLTLSMSTRVFLCNGVPLTFISHDIWFLDKVNLLE